jgi:hypothetical protein
VLACGVEVAVGRNAIVELEDAQAVDEAPGRARRIGVVANGAKRWPAGAVFGAGRTQLAR